MSRRHEAQRFGRRAEFLVSIRYLLRGYRVIERNHRHRRGEIDLILRRGKLIVFVEVKARRGALEELAALAVDEKKKGRIIAAAGRWRAINSTLAEGRLLRFDVAIVTGSGWIPRMKVYDGAFINEQPAARR